MDSHSNDYYKLLDIDKNADKSTIKKAYRKLVKKYHPDLVTDPSLKSEYSKKIAEITNAYETLIDDKKKEIYDKYGPAGEPSKNINIDPMDIFNNLFGGNIFGFNNGNRQTKPIMKMKPILHRINVSLADLYLGKKIKLAITRKAIFKSDCLITENFDSTWFLCDNCKGRGSVTEIREVQRGFVEQYQHVCTKCKGYGYILKDEYKLIDHKQIIEIDVKRGMTNNTEIYFPNMGDCGPGFYPGDIKILICSNDTDNGFTRRGNDLYYNKDILLSEALTGFKFCLKGLDDKIICIKCTNTIISPNESKIIKGYGMPILNNSETFGNLIITFNIIFPTTLTSDNKNKLLNILPRGDKCPISSDVSIINLK